MSTKKTTQIDRNMNAENCTDVSEMFKQYLGSPVCILCARYHYNGVVTAIGENFVALANAVSIENSGAAQADRPTNFDRIGATVIVMIGAIELVHQPKWVGLCLEDNTN